MRTTIFALLIVLLSSLNAYAQAKEDSVTNEAINKIRDAGIFENQRLCYYFLAYDRMAWVSSNMVMDEPKENLTNLGREWFCYEDDNLTWHAIYGKYEDGDYSVGLHYICDSLYQDITKTHMYKDEDFYTTYGKCINKAYKEMENDSANFKIRYNHYVKEDSLKNVGVWIFPSFQDGKAVYGREYYYKFDPSGKKLIDKKIVHKEIKYFTPDTSKDIYLDYEDYDAPTLGSLFYLLYYQHYLNYFKSITIVTKDMYHNIMDGIFLSYIREETEE